MFRYGLCNETTGEDENGAAGGGGDDEAGAAGAGAVDGESARLPDGDAGAGGGGGDSADSGSKEQAPKDMKAAIDAALGYQGEGSKPAAEKPAEKKPAAAGGQDGKPKDEKGQDEKPKLAPKPKTSAELDMKPEQLKMLKPETQMRFREVIGALKAHESTIAKQGENIKVLTEARDTILGVLEETHTTQEELAGYLEFNAMVKSGDPKQLEAAIGFVEKQRAALYKAIGKEPAGGGIDLLADFPDLKQQVENEDITRQVALELAASRRDKAAAAEAERQKRTQQQGEKQSKEQFAKSVNEAADAIESWAVGVSKSDIDWKAKESILLERIEEVKKQYPPRLWLPTLKLMYEGIVVEKAPAKSGPQPLRPSGAKTGDKQPGSMLEAINSGLGYAPAAK